MMMRTGQIPERQAVGGSVLVISMIMTMVRGRRPLRAVRKRPGKGRE